MRDVLTASFGVTGYSLSRDQIGYWTVKIVTIVPETIVIIGSPLIELLRESASVVCGTIHFDSFLLLTDFLYCRFLLLYLY